MYNKKRTYPNTFISVVSGAIAKAIIVIVTSHVMFMGIARIVVAMTVDLGCALVLIMTVAIHSVAILFMRLIVVTMKNSIVTIVIRVRFQ